MNIETYNTLQDEDLTHVLQLESSRQAAMLAGDTARLRGLLTEEVVYVHSSGLVEGLEPYLESIGSGNVIYEGLQLKVNEARRLCDDAILLVGTAQMQTIQYGREKALHNVFMMVWTRAKNGVWRMASWQSTAIPTQ
jgi:hypothetical protein